MFIKLSLLIWLINAAETIEVFTSRCAMNNAYDLEKHIIDHLRKASADEKGSELEAVKLFLDEYDHIHDKYDTAKLEERYLDNPINAYALIRRMSVDWRRLMAYMADVDGSSKQLAMVDRLLRSSLVTDQDLDGAVTALLRLQRMHRISVEQMAAGRVAASLAEKHLGVEDCLRIVARCLSQQDPALAADWLSYTTRRAIRQQRNDQTTRDLLCYSEITEQDIRQSINTVNEMVKNRGIDQRQGDLLLNTFHDKLKKLTSLRIYLNPTDGDFPTAEKSSSKNNKRKETIRNDILKHRSSEEELIFERGPYVNLCQLSAPPNASTANGLRCHYEAANPFLKLQPIRTEVISQSPLVLLYHDVVSAAEMAAVKQRAAGAMRPSRVTNDQVSEVYVETARVAQVGWLSDTVDPLLQRISRRIGHITGLDLADSQPLQVSNYGLAGHFSPHTDGNPQLNNPRLATFMMYGSDVRAGGYTVFTKLKLQVQPRRGSALFWYNYRRSGAEDERLFHAGCPVLVGNKWVFNKWILSDGQMFRRQCGLNPDD